MPRRPSSAGAEPGAAGSPATNRPRDPAPQPLVEMDPRQRLAAVVESSDDAILSKTLDGTILTWNHAAERLFGYTAAEMVGQSIFRLVPEPEVEELRAIHARIARGERVPAFPTVRLRRDGSPLDVVCSISPVHDQGGEVVGASTIMRDISEQLKEQRDRELVLELTSAMLSEEDPGAMIDGAADRMARYLGVAQCLFGDVEQESGTIRYRPVPAPSGAAVPEFSCPMRSLGHAGLSALEEGLPYTITNAGQDGTEEEEQEDATVVLPVLSQPGAPPARSLLRVPLLSNGRPAALIELRDTRPHAWAKHEITLAGSALQRLWPLVEMGRARVAEHAARVGLERLQRAVAAVVEALDADEVAHALMDEVLALAGAAMGVVGFLAEDRRRFEIVAHAGTDETEGQRWLRFLNVPGVGVRDVVTNGEPLFFSSRDAYVERYPAGARLASVLGLGALAILPIASPDRTFGAVALGFRAAHPFPATECDLLTTFAHQCGRALERAALYDAEREAREAAELAHTEVEVALEQTRAAYEEAEAARRDAQVLALSLERANQELHRLAESTEAANRAKSDFLAVMSHELRTPLNAVIGYAQILALGIHGPLSEPQLEQIGRIERSAHHLLRIIEGVLAFTRVEAGKANYDFEDVPIGAALTGVEVLVGPAAEEKGIQVSLENASCFAMVHVDVEKLRQVVVNLVNNAIKFTPSGGRVRVECQTTDDEVVLRVHDTGIGIPAEKLEVVFEPFVQVDMRLSRQFGGTGLGLAIAREFARGMGGDISVVSVLGQGSTFSLRLPRLRKGKVERKA